MLFFLVALLFWTCVFALFHSYVLFPVLLNRWAKGKTNNVLCYAPLAAELPMVSIFMAVYNEEKVLEEKLRSIFEGNYPLDRLEVLIGSDSSTDRTHAILAEFAAQYPQLRYWIYSRRGKANILNSLHEEAEPRGEVFVYTDANVFFLPDALYHLVKHFKNPKIGQVCAHFVNQGMQRSGISYQEKSYIQRETKIKYQEGVLWGSMMGAFGGCHAIRAALYVPNPPNFLMEDFYISMHVLKQGYWAILELEAKVLEDLPKEVQEEYKRKIRISAGNFQNLSVYYPLLFPPFSGLAFSFWSHKVLRWLGPFVLALALMFNVLLAFAWGGNLFYQILFYCQLVGWGLVPLLDWLLQRVNIHFSLFRYVRYFLAMNIALFQGFLTYLKGVQTNVWQPTKRNTNQ
jgi:cellulose synthase/poly-beta-1,6-N-acetylglucosamine synthase-like glycosyltransferase